MIDPTQKSAFLMMGEMVVDLISTDLVGSLAEAESFQRFAGGTVANLSFNLHRLGHPVSLSACIGSDGFGVFLADQLTSAGISRDLIQITDQAPTTLIPIARSTGTPDFLIFRGADQYLSLTPELEKAAERSRFFHTSAFALSRNPARKTILTILRSARNDGKIISFDPNYHPAHQGDLPDFLPLLEEILQIAAITKPSLDDSRRIFGGDLDPSEYLDRFLGLGAEIVVLTLGEKGALVGLSTGERYHLQPNPVNVLDVTGAGDAFWSGLLAGLDHGLLPLDAAKLGQAVAEYKIGVMGPVLDHPSLEDYLKLSGQIQVNQV